MRNPHHLSKLLLAPPLLLLAALLGACAPAAPAAPPAAAAPQAGVAAVAPQVAVAAAAASTCDAPEVSAYIAYANHFTGIDFSGVADEFQLQATSPESGIPGPVTGPVTIDANVTASQLDSTIDEATVALLTAHGTPTGIEVTEGGGTTSLPFGSSKLGQCETGRAGSLRYLLIASCNVMEHGPQTCTNVPASLPYSCPGEWSPNSSNSTMQNIYARWGTRLGNGLRMVCGPSTTLTPQSINNMWAEHLHTRLADKVLYVLSQDADSSTVGVSVGVCLALGGSAFSDSPLMHDDTFETTANPYDDVASPLYHLQYTRPFSATYGMAVAMSNGTWQNAPALDEFRNFSAAGPRCLPTGQFGDQPFPDPEPGKQQELSDGFGSEAEAIAYYGKDRDYFSLAAAEAQKYAEDKVSLELATGVYNLLSTFPVDENLWQEAVPSVALKNVFISIPQIVRFNDLGLTQELESRSTGDWRNLPRFFAQMSITYDRGAYNLGDGLEPLMPMLFASQLIQLNPDGTPIMVWNNTAPFVPDGYEAVRPVDEAFLRSLWQLYYSQFDLGSIGDAQSDDALVTDYLDAGHASPEDIIYMLYSRYGEDRQPYVLDSWTLGYTLVDWSTEVAPKLRLVYRFRFVANDHTDTGYTAADFPPINIDVAAQTGQPCE